MVSGFIYGYKKQYIYSILKETKIEIDNRISMLKNKVSILSYAHLTREVNGVKVWTDAICEALPCSEIVEIPYNDAPYYIDKTLVIPSGRRTLADKNAVIKSLLTNGSIC